MKRRGFVQVFLFCNHAMERHFGQKGIEFQKDTELQEQYIEMPSHKKKQYRDTTRNPIEKPLPKITCREYIIQNNMSIIHHSQYHIENPSSKKYKKTYRESIIQNNKKNISKTII